MKTWCIDNKMGQYLFPLFDGGNLILDSKGPRKGELSFRIMLILKGFSWHLKEVPAGWEDKVLPEKLCILKGYCE